MRDIERLFNEYSESHMNPTNKLIHSLAVPAIYFSVIGLIWSIPVPDFVAQYDINFAHIIAVPVLYYYFLLSGPIGAAMTLLTIACFLLLEQIAASTVAVWQVSVGVFIIMWILQFVGHAIEGKRPSFFTDLRFLLIGPAWVWGGWLKRFNINY
ncbi:Mpo1 family 2-hydroxy fatty acid dioxygenase [Alteromonas lipolytica]|uniref:PRS2 protein n=1 Tax=Alteromonas lipolytica TaxID=1856405 RepID=A0A1E8FI07_9ALTE|nr:Mpo1-like protein [Alteromonas lipolytica]OFI35113.1 hypothetical protein BFC17_16330 [Alteromonas lipolytica]GGF56791.1 hypothetical protein GCM10011338_06330 [Alteromonas lipolytica]